MRRKAYTLIEVILAIFLIGLISVFFLPAITSGYKNILHSQSFTTALYEDQEAVENEIDRLRGIDPNSISDPTKTKVFNIYGKNIKAHHISLSSHSSGEINALIPLRDISPSIPVIQTPPSIVVRRGVSNVYPQPTIIDLYDDIQSFFVNEIVITNATKSDYLMSVYRWYMSSEMHSSQVPTNNISDYFILKEWNEAKKQLSFHDSSQLKFIPNIKDKYNTLSLIEVKGQLFPDDESFINTLGNRYIRYGVTPFAISGHIGKEELSNLIYIKAPRIEFDRAEFFEREDTVVGEEEAYISHELHIYFKSNIGLTVDVTKIQLNENLGEIRSAYRDDIDKKLLILEFDYLDTSQDIDGNRLFRGSVEDENYGKIGIWTNNQLETDFLINKYNP